ncbi:Metal transporter cnnm2, variant 2 [Bonamia ostreae]|uniref:Metal transporter cnnm2, variant 2 n=1 Tax=Bonamia ostreae TaxID=126728 RepID=A0ABV2AJL5_9EUKA
MSLADICNAVEGLANCKLEDPSCLSIRTIASKCKINADPLIPRWALAICVGILVAFSGMLAGLTLGLFSLDISELRVLKESSRPNIRRYAKRILFVRKHGNWLLCTLLIGNVGVNVALTVLSDDLFNNNPALSFLLSSTLIAFFGEILPQAVCTRWALSIGYYCVPFVVVVMFLLCPLAWPLGKFFDKTLGKEIGMIFTNDELKHLINMHVKTAGAELCEEQGRIINGALDFFKLTVDEVLTPWHHVFCLRDSTRLTFGVLLDVFKTGFSRIPVINRTGHAVGLLFVKDLVLIDPEDATPVSSLLRLYGRNLEFVRSSDPLKSIMATFVSGRSHLAVVVSEDGEPDEKDKIVSARKARTDSSKTSSESSSCSDDSGVFSKLKRLFRHDRSGSKYLSKGIKESLEEVSIEETAEMRRLRERKPVGIVCLEDMVEKILDLEIVDETDVYVNPKEKNLVNRAPFDVSKLSVFDYRRTLPKHYLVPPEVTAAAHHLFASLSKKLGDSKNEYFDLKTTKLLLRLSKVEEVLVEHLSLDECDREKGFRFFICDIISKCTKN